MAWARAGVAAWDLVKVAVLDQVAAATSAAVTRNDGGGGPGGGGGGTDYNKIFSGKDVTSKARVLSKPEPQYTEEARKNQVTGTVVLRRCLRPAAR